jgi:hypothetical protein
VASQLSRIGIDDGGTDIAAGPAMRILILTAIPTGAVPPYDGGGFEPGRTYEVSRHAGACLVMAGYAQVDRRTSPDAFEWPDGRERRLVRPTR